MDSKTRYRLAEQDAMRRLAELQEESPRLSDDDVALTRYLIEQAADAGNPSLAEKLLCTLARLTTAADTSAEKHGELIARNKLLELARDLTALVVKCFEDSCDDWEERIDQLTEMMLSKLEVQE